MPRPGFLDGVGECSYSCFGAQYGRIHMSIYGVVVKIMVPCWVPEILGAAVYYGPKIDDNFDNHPYKSIYVYCVCQKE